MRSTRAALSRSCTAEGVRSLLVANNVDILVNNAGIYGPQDFYTTDDETGTLLAD